ncbi:F0F1 ATP synthase subunit epsilon [Woodsholea maritima]|uniref:F0F1 ATP synthase subunit epsilon n=1 Tax=Woodsholea maritima TaxID=240237 RepID=UPI00037AB23A|nr:F0F1 ATP synthase subunit epsilon [Woodsholea maritima]
MGEKLHFDLVAPEKRLFQGEVDMVVAPGSEGDFTVLPDHAPFMSAIRSGAIEIHKDGAVEKTFIHGGFAEVTPEGLTILAEEAIRLNDIDQAWLDQELKNTKEDVQDAKDDSARNIAQQKLAKLEAMKSALANA